MCGPAVSQIDEQVRGASFGAMAEGIRLLYDILLTYSGDYLTLAS